MTVLPRPRCASLAVLSSTLLHRPPPPPFLPSRPQLQLRPRPRALTTTAALRTTYRRSQDFTSGFSSTYDPTEDEGRGPMFSKPTFGVPSFYPRDLKKRVDEYVVGQDRAKKTICSVIFNHYQNLRRRHHHDIQDQRMREKLQRQRFARDRDLHDRQGYADVHPVEDDFPGHNESVRGIGLGNPEPVDDFYVPEDPTVPQHVKIDKSNLLLLGPTGVGKTYILETLSKKLNVPFTISDCNSFTQAGYIGQDVETCIERLLIEANYDIKAAEHGIVVLDEFDKIARRETVNGRDVGGEGVQQALLKLVEGTKVTINVKDNRSSRPSPSSPLMGGGIGGSTGQPGSPPPSPPSGGGKVDQYTIDTTNILFVFCGAFVGLDKAVLKRVSKHSMGFGAEIRRAAAASASLQGSTDVLPAEMYAHLPHQPHPTVLPPDSSPSSLADTTTRPTGFTPLDLTTPTDLQAFGFIPELIGRVHNICALSPLSRAELLRVLTEPRNSLVAQYTALFETYPSRLRFTRRALRAVAERAARNETGARGLKMEMERVLAEPMFEAPTPYVLITEACVRGAEKAGYWGKDGGLEVERRIADEDRGLDEEDEEGRRRGGGERVVESSFEQFREAGLSGA